VNDFFKKNKKHFKKSQVYSLVFIVYTVFCKTFDNDNNNTTTTKTNKTTTTTNGNYDDDEKEAVVNTNDYVVDIVLMILFQTILLLSFMVMAWYSVNVVFPNRPKLRVMGLFGCTHKTVAMGIPLINAIFEDHPYVGLYTLPLLVWHPSQLMIGTFLSPRLSSYVKNHTNEEEEEEEAEEEVEEENEKRAEEKDKKENKNGHQDDNNDQGIVRDEINKV